MTAGPDCDEWLFTAAVTVKRWLCVFWVITCLVVGTLPQTGLRVAVFLRIEVSDLRGTVADVASQSCATSHVTHTTKNNSEQHVLLSLAHFTIYSKKMILSDPRRLNVVTWSRAQTQNNNKHISDHYGLPGIIRLCIHINWIVWQERTHCIAVVSTSCNVATLDVYVVVLSVCNSYTNRKISSLIMKASKWPTLKSASSKWWVQWKANNYTITDT